MSNSDLTLMIDSYILVQQIRLSEILACLRKSYLTQDFTRGLFIGCIGNHAHRRQVTSAFRQDDVIIWYCISAYLGTSGSLF